MERKKLEGLVWKHTHADFKGKIDGVKTVLHNLGGKGTGAVPLSAFTEAELIGKLPSRIREELKVRGEL